MFPEVISLMLLFDFIQTALSRSFLVRLSLILSDKVSMLPSEGNTCEQATTLHHKPHLTIFFIRFWDDALEHYPTHRLNRLNQGQMAVSYESHISSSFTNVVHSPHQTDKHTIAHTFRHRKWNEECEIHHRLNHCSGKLCVFVCWHRRVWVYEHESIRMWVSECTHSHILTVHNILLWQLAGNGHHRLTVYDNKQTCSRSPPLHRYLFNLCAYVFVCGLEGVSFLILWL